MTLSVFIRKLKLIQDDELGFSRISESKPSKLGVSQELTLSYLCDNHNSKLGQNLSDNGRNLMNSVDKFKGKLVVSEDCRNYDQDENRWIERDFLRLSENLIQYLDSVELKPHSISVDEDLDEAAKKSQEFESALQNGCGKVPSGGVISVKSSKTKPEKHGKSKDNKSDKKRSKDGSSSKSSKKRRT
ncbi:hypothetical protein L1987_61311 [Smallanthus sonchifolius]|uniref:Uncharacterized protein n=1 Tax=Smallanthus sonchifolius TaxID=185202 RepID=A0ACB9DAT3_9ASTR|nr:hypothetical protein L1987_61311 [Smallanthus sonchifolius]